MTKLRLSHTQIETYKQCPKKYENHYIERLREDATSSPLFFGSALDKAVNELLKTKIKDQDPKEIKSAYDVLDECINFTEINGELVDLRNTTKARYSKADYDPKLLDEDSLQLISEKATNRLQLEDIDLLVSRYPDLSNEELILYNFIHLECLRKKSHLLLKTYEEEILPRIKEVTSIQKKVNLENADGDTLMGFIDFIAEWEDGSLIVFDNKTSARKYLENSAKESQQLSIYGENEGIFKVGYIVMLKNIKYLQTKQCDKCSVIVTSRHKNCTTKGCNGSWRVTEIPRAEIQVVIDTLDPKYQEQVFKEIQEINYKIRHKIFPANWNSCFMFNRKCQFYEYCRNGDKTGLVKSEEKK